MAMEVVQCMSKLKVKTRKQLQSVCVCVSVSVSVCLYIYIYIYIYITVQDYDGGSPCHAWSHVLHGLRQSSRVRTW